MPPRPVSGLRKRIEQEDSAAVQAYPRTVSNFMFSAFKLPDFVPIDAESIDLAQPNAIPLIARKVLVLEQNYAEINRAVEAIVHLNSSQEPWEERINVIVDKIFQQYTADNISDKFLYADKQISRVQQILEFPNDTQVSCTELAERIANIEMHLNSDSMKMLREDYADIKSKLQELQARAQQMKAADKQEKPE